MITVNMNPKPNARAISLRRFFSIINLDEYSFAEDISSDVISKIIAMTANQRLMSDKVIGKLIFSPPLVGTKPQWLVHQRAHYPLTA